MEISKIWLSLRSDIFDLTLLEKTLPPGPPCVFWSSMTENLVDKNCLLNIARQFTSWIGVGESIISGLEKREEKVELGNKSSG